MRYGQLFLTRCALRPVAQGRLRRRAPIQGETLDGVGVGGGGDDLRLGALGGDQAGVLAEQDEGGAADSMGQQDPKCERSQGCTNEHQRVDSLLHSPFSFLPIPEMHRKGRRACASKRYRGHS